MPRGDKTGPNGQGPMTGRRMGFCAGANAPGFMNSGFSRSTGRDFGRGFGRGLGWRQGFQQAQPIQQIQPTVITEKQEKQFLEQELSALKEDIKEIEKRLKEMKN